jgi:hypothetical protein
MNADKTKAAYPRLSAFIRVYRRPVVFSRVLLERCSSWLFFAIFFFAIFAPARDRLPYVLSSPTISAAILRAASSSPGARLIAPTRACPPPP